MNRYRILLLIVLLTSLGLISCNKNTSAKEPETQVLQTEMEQPVSAQEEIQVTAPVEVKETKPKLEPTEEDIVRDMDRFFLYEDWHPLKQTEYIKEIKERLKDKEKEDVDETLYEDEFTTEFSLHDETRNFCLYHNIRNVKKFDISEFEIFNYDKITQGYFNGLEIVQCFIEKDGISVAWSDDTGVILIIGTEDSRYSTKRDVHVGDSAEKIMEAYESDCTIKIKNYETSKFEVVSEKKFPCMVLSKSNECISLNAGNMVEEEVMNLQYMLKDDVVYKIIIRCGN